VISFTDRPTRRASSESLKTFVSSWTSRFRTSAPNAAIELSDQGRHQDVLVVTLSKPTYDAGANTVTYTLKRLTGKGSVGIKDFINRADKGLPRSFGHVDLFIDPSDQEPIPVEINVASPTADVAFVTFTNVQVQSDVTAFDSTGPAHLIVNLQGLGFEFKNPFTGTGKAGVSVEVLPAVSRVRANVQELPAGATLTAQSGTGKPVTTTKTGAISIPTS
jgi:hypothetical protein